MLIEKQNFQVFILSVPQITKLSLRAHILLVAYYLYHSSGQPDFSQTILRNNFLTARLPYDEKRVKGQFQELLKGDKASIINMKHGRYTLSIYGDEEVKTYLKSKPQIETGILALKELMAKIQDENQKAFLAEAISCAEMKSFRSAIVMTWLFVVDHLQEYVLRKEKIDFNNAMSQRSDAEKLHLINTKDDFEYLKESIFIEILQSANIITKTVKRILSTKLDTRNTCAHPANIIIKESAVVEFVETLVDNVVLKYK